MTQEQKQLLLKDDPCSMNESEAYKKAKSNNCAFIVEDGWIVRVMADDTRERIKYIGSQEVKVETIGEDF